MKAPEQEGQADEQDAGDQDKEDLRPVKARHHRRHEKGDGGDDQDREQIEGDLIHKAGCDLFAIFPMAGGAEQKDEDQDAGKKAQPDDPEDGVAPGVEEGGQSRSLPQVAPRLHVPQHITLDCEGLLRNPGVHFLPAVKTVPFAAAEFRDIPARGIRRRERRRDSRLGSICIRLRRWIGRGCGCGGDHGKVLIGHRHVIPVVIGGAVAFHILQGVIGRDALRGLPDHVLVLVVCPEDIARAVQHGAAQVGVAYIAFPVFPVDMAGIPDEGFGPVRHHEFAKALIGIGVGVPLKEQDGGNGRTNAGQHQQAEQDHGGELCRKAAVQFFHGDIPP